VNSFDSAEELYFSWWADELFKAGYIKSYYLHPETYILSEPYKYKYDKHLKTKTKTIETTLLQPHAYTPDFRITWNPQARGFFFLSTSNQIYLKNAPIVAQETEDGYKNYYSVVEIKAGFSKYNMDRLFSVNQKWMLQKHGIYVQKIVITKLFKKTFTPARYLLTNKSGKARKIKFKVRTLQEFVNAET